MKLSILREALRTKARSWRINVQDQGVIQKIEKAERALHEPKQSKMRFCKNYGSKDG